MVWCTTCNADMAAEVDDTRGFTCCTGCGRVLDETAFSTDPTFSKAANGASTVDGNFVPDGGGGGGMGKMRGARIFGYQVDSHEKTIAKGKYEISQVSERLGIRPREEMVSAAHRLYKLAVQRNFTRGRRTAQVASACLYIVCRQEGRPYMLIDFSDALQTNVYVLGSVFLQLCRLLRLEQHPIMQRPVDPSLFIHRFADKLDLGRKSNAVATTALRLVASMKRDWMQTGRRPSGICGAALFIAAHIHGLSRGKKEVVQVVHVCEATLQKRLTEFQLTGSSDLTVEEFDQRANDVGTAIFRPPTGAKDGEIRELTCEHRKQPGIAHFAHGMCLACYQQFDKVSGGLHGGFDPPAFRAAQLKEAAKREARMKMALEAQDLQATKSIATELESALQGDATLRRVAQRALPEGQRPPLPDRQNGAGTAGEGAGASAAELMPPPATKGSGVGDVQVAAAGGGAGPATQLPLDDSDLEFDDDYEEKEHPNEETLSDVDDDEIDMYIHTEQEVKLKEKVWRKLNAEYLKEQDQKAAQAAALEKANAKKIAEGGRVPKVGAERKGKNRIGQVGVTPMAPSAPPKSAGEAAAQMLAKKRISTKINYDALDRLFSDVGAGKKGKSGSKGGSGGVKKGHAGKSKGKGKASGRLASVSAPFRLGSVRTG